MKKPEILAPAGSFESLISAVRCGADAVYLGANGFNARANAQNFDIEQLKEAVKYCHLRGVKVYQTLNTLVFDRELESLIEQIKQSAQAGVDALIVQDLGVASIVRKVAPTIDIHASTQMSIMNKEGLEIVKQLGISRVVLARELTKEEIISLKNCGIELEVFVHGALCMSVSGQCYMSVMIGGRSGNRGQCAQPCRLPFCAEEGKIENALSLKDLSLVSQINELVDIGVCSLKIEGRMKRPEYVAAAVTACKAVLEGNEPDIKMLEGVFSRSGFTDGYFNNQIDTEMFGIRRKEDVVSSGDVLKQAGRLYKDELSSIGLKMTFKMHVGDLPSLTIEDKNGNTVFVEGGESVQKAISKPTDKPRIEQNLGKLGGTPYYIDTLECSISDDGMMPVSQLNALRRDAVEKLDAIRNHVTQHQVHDYEFKDKIQESISPLNLRARVLSVNQLSDSLIESCELISMPYQTLLQAIESKKLPAHKAVIELPRIMFESEHKDIDSVIVKLKSFGISKAWCGNLGSIQKAKQHSLDIIGGFSLNITNSVSVSVLKELGVTQAEISIEAPLSDIKNISREIPLGIVGYGYLPLMTFRNCPIKAAIGCEECGGGFNMLIDRMNQTFEIDCSTGTAELFNSVPLVLSDRVQELKSFDFMTLFFTNQSKSEIDNVILSYQNGQPLSGDKTRGIYYRGLTE